MKKHLKTTFCLLILTIFLFSSLVDGARNNTTVTILSGSAGIEAELFKSAAQRYMKKHPQVKVRVMEVPEKVEQRLAFFLQLLESKNSKIDIYEFDVIWPSLLEKHFINLNKYGGKKIASRYFKSLIENNTVNRKLVAIPLFVDAGLLYYRSDLLQKYNLKPPKTWDQLEKSAQIIQKGERQKGNKDFWGFVWQGDKYEGLTCDALEWIYSNNGGTIISQDKKITINNQNAIAMLDRAAGWVGSISPPDVTKFTEEISRNFWQVGNAAFMRNWPYAYALGNADKSAIKGKFDVSPLPAGKNGKPAATLGGWQLAASKYSKNPKVAADLLFFFASAQEQKYRAMKSSYLPTVKKLYQDRELIKNKPFIGKLYNVFINTVARPSTPTGIHYNEVSSKFFYSVHAVLTGKKDAATALKQLEKDLQKITGFQVGRVQ